MASKQPVWGIDVGQCLLKAIKLQATEDDQVELIGVDVVEHEKILSEAEDEAVDLVQKALNTFRERNDLSDAQVAISVPGQHTLTRFTKMPPVEPKKIPDMVQYEASQQIPFDMDEVVWDYQVFSEADSPDVEVGIFAIRKELIRNYLLQYTDIGIEPMLVQTSPMASYNTILFEKGQKEGEATILLDMGALATDLIVVEGRRIWSRPIPIGGNRFTEALVQTFKLSFEKAEKLKRNAASSKYARQVFQAMRPVFADLVSEVQRSVGFYTSTHRESKITSVIGMGNAFKLPGLQKFLQQNLRMQVDKLSGFSKLRIVGEPKPEFKNNVMSFSVAYGVALQGLGLGNVESNLLPTEVRKSLLWKKKRWWFGASAAALALAASSLYVSNVMAQGQINQAKGSLAQISPQPAGNVDNAQRTLESGGGAAPLEKAAKILGAMQTLRGELQRVQSKQSAEKGLLDTMAKLPANNIYVPRIFDTIHRAVNAVMADEIASARDPESYLRVAALRPRDQRIEVWIDDIEMTYDVADPSRYVKGEPKSGSGRRQAGWLVKIRGRTTAQSPVWIDQSLIKELLEQGRAPNLGFYFDSVTLAGVAKGDDLPETGPVGPGGASRGLRTPAQRGNNPRAAPRGRNPHAAPRGLNPRQRDSRQRMPPGTRTQRGPGGQVEGGTRLIEQVLKLRLKYQSLDPLTLEPLEHDQTFEIHVVVHKADTPDNLVPERFKEKPPAEAEGEGNEATS